MVVPAGGARIFPIKQQEDSEGGEMQTGCVHGGRVGRGEHGKEISWKEFGTLVGVYWFPHGKRATYVGAAVRKRSAKKCVVSIFGWCVCVCVCVCQRERERERECTQKIYSTLKYLQKKSG